MPVGVFEAFLRPGPAFLLGGMVALFTCSRVLASVFPRGEGAIGRRALAYFIPIAASSLIAMLLGRSEIAVGIVFGTSVGAMTTVVGFIALAGPIGDGPPRWRRVWPFQLVASLLVLIAGFKGTFNWRDAFALSIEGLILLMLWNDTSDATPQSVLNSAWNHGGLPAGPTDEVARFAKPGWTSNQIGLLILELALTAALLWLGSWAVTRGIVRTGTMIRGLSTSGLAGSVVSLSMVLPMMYGTWRQADGGRGWAPVTTQVGVVLLNLCALLPLLILLPYLAARIPQLSHWAGDALAPRGGLPTLLLYPTPMWRIDNVVLIVIGVLLLPVALGKWRLGREEGMVLMAGYFFYLTATLAGGFDSSAGQ
jgi:hypothetical protein